MRFRQREGGRWRAIRSHALFNAEMRHLVEIYEAAQACGNQNFATLLDFSLGRIDALMAREAACARSSSATERPTACPGSWGSERGQRCAAPRSRSVGRWPGPCGHAHRTTRGLRRAAQSTRSRRAGRYSRQLVAQYVHQLQRHPCRAVPGRMGRTGTLFRALRPVAVGLRACRERAEITSPMRLFCREARLFAATSTPSLIVSVVRISNLHGCRIKHHASCQARVLVWRTAQVTQVPPPD